MVHHVRARERAFVVRFLFPRVYSFFSPLSPPKSLVDQSWRALTRRALCPCSFYALLDSLSFPLSLSLFISPSVSLPSLSFIFLLVCSSYKGGVKLRNELSRNDAFFSARDHEKKRDHPSKFDYTRIYTFSATVTRSKRVSPFRLFGLFFSFFVSLFRLLTSASKEAAPFESESRERERALLPSWCIFPNNKKSSQNTTTASEDVIYIHTHTYTRHTKHIAILYDSQ